MRQILWKRATKRELAARARRLSNSKIYNTPHEVWVDDGHVFIKDHDGLIVSMTPNVAIKLGQLIADAAAESLINKVMDDSEY